MKKKTKLLIENLKGNQELIEVGQGGRYFDESKVLWDERKNGKWDTSWNSQIGGLVPVGDGKSKSFNFDQSLKDAQDARLQSEADEKLAKKNEKNQRINALKNINSINDLDGVKAVLSALAKEVLDLEQE